MPLRLRLPLSPLLRHLLLRRLLPLLLRLALCIWIRPLLLRRACRARRRRRGAGVWGGKSFIRLSSGGGFAAAGSGHRRGVARARARPDSLQSSAGRCVLVMPVVLVMMVMMVMPVMVVMLMCFCSPVMSKTV